MQDEKLAKPRVNTCDLLTCRTSEPRNEPAWPRIFGTDFWKRASDRQMECNTGKNTGNTGKKTNHRRRGLMS